MDTPKGVPAMLTRLFNRLLQSVIITSTVYLTMNVSQSQPSLVERLPDLEPHQEAVEATSHWPI
jgi:hypothetical protein